VSRDSPRRDLTVPKAPTRTITGSKPRAERTAGTAQRALLVGHGGNRVLLVGLLMFLLLCAALPRFSNLGGESEMSSDEGADWAAAAAPTLSEVQRLGIAYNPGKLALYDMTLHLWIRVFGDKLGAMRALSATLGVLDVLLLFVVVREMFGASSGAQNGEPSINPAAIALLAALVMALSVTMVKYSREIRMYPLLLALILLQVWWFFRLRRQEQIEDYVCLALLTALALAANFTAALVVVAEGVWLLPSLLGLPLRFPLTSRWRAWLTVATLGVGCAVFAFPLLYQSARLADLVRHGEYVFIQPITTQGAIETLWDAGGKFAFPVIAALAAYGSLRGWRRAPEAVAFLVSWFCVPILLAVLISWVVTPFFVERYVLSSFLPLFVLAGLGVWELRRLSQIGALTLLVALQVCDFHYYNRSESDYQWGVQWREAAATAAATHSTVGVEPPIAHHVVEYYLGRSGLPPESYRNNFIGGREGEVLIVADQIPICQPREAAELFSEYSKTLAHLRGVVVVRR